MRDENFLIPTIAQNVDTGQVLMLAYSNRESLRRTLETGEAHYWSRSRNRLWRKGETSGNKQDFVSAAIDCDSDTLLFQVRPAGPACHTGAPSCFFTPVEDLAAAGFKHSGVAEKAEGGRQKAGGETKEVHGDRAARPGGEPSRVEQEAGWAASGVDTFAALFQVIESRRRDKPEGSYTVKLLDGGVDRIGKKIAEEAGEVIIAAKNQSKQQLLWESADLVYHLMVLLASQSVQWSELAVELEKRRK